MTLDEIIDEMVAENETIDSVVISKYIDAYPQLRRGLIDFYVKWLWCDLVDSQQVCCN